MIATLALIVWTSVAPMPQQHDHAAMTQASQGATSLTAEQIAQLLAGEGMGLAKPAELNHYPGPRHVIDLADALKLSAEQRRRVEAVRAAMLASAKRLGAQIIEAERGLDAAFRSGRITGDQLRELTAAAGRLQGELRAVHLAAHLETRELLTPDQIKEYDRLRGYSQRP